LDYLDIGVKKMFSGGMRNFARKLDEYAKSRGWTHVTLAQLLDVSKNTAIAYRTNPKKNPTSTLLLNLERASGVPVSYWIDDSVTEPPVADEDAIAIRRVVQQLGPQEALRRLLGQPPEPGKLPGLEIVHAHDVPRREPHDQSKAPIRHRVRPDRPPGR
jgi:transcriptional regulator with XRE-family HTH domain